jgi:hypothetical protein
MGYTSAQMGAHTKIQNLQKLKYSSFHQMTVLAPDDDHNSRNTALRDVEKLLKVS